MSTSDAIARRLADEAPTTMLPCPVCAAAVRGRNLDEHLRKVHDLTQPSAASSWRGADGRMRIITMVPVVLWLGALAGVVVVDLPNQWNQVVMGVWVLGFIVTSGIAVLAFMGKFAATLAIGDAAVELSYGLGMLRVVATLPVGLETGALQEARPSNLVQSGQGLGGYVEDIVDVGAYVRLTGENGRTVTVGARRGAKVQKYWYGDGLTRGPARRLWDIDLGAAELVQLQYQLADRGMLRLRVES